MKQLILIRHADSDQHIGLSDFERPLNLKGELSAELMGKKLLNNKLVFDRIFCSSAKRALSTAKIIGEAIGYPEQRFVISSSLYTFDDDALFRFIEELDDQLDSVVIVGHNPAMTLLLNDLTQASINNLPPCAAAQIELAINDWIDIQPGCGKLRHLELPAN